MVFSKILKGFFAIVLLNSIFFAVISNDLKKLQSDFTSCVDMKDL